MARIAHIVSTARYLPGRVVTNLELAARFTALGHPGVVEKFAHSTGIGQRFYVPDDWATSDLALPAAKEALKRAGRKPTDLDLIIVATGSPDYITPDTSAVLQHKLGARNAGALDVRCACASFTTALAVASGLIASNPAINTILVTAAEMLHRLADADDPTCFLWGDGAGAVVLESGGLEGFVGAAFQADGAYASYWGIFAGGTAEPASVDAVKAGRTKVRRLRNYPADEETWARLFKRLANENDFTADEVDQLLFTQINKPAIAIAADLCNVPMAKCHTIMEKCGYTGAACIPMALDDAIELGKIKCGDLVVLIASGVGYNQAAAAVRMTI